MNGTKIRISEILLGILITISLAWSGWCTTQIIELSKGQASHNNNDDTRVAALDRRVGLLEVDMRTSNDLRAEVGKLGVRLDERLKAIDDQLRKIEENSAIIKLKAP